MTKKLFALSIAVAALLAPLAFMARSALADVDPVGTGAGSAPAAPAAPPAPAAGFDVAEARKACAAALNADPKFEAEIVKTADEKAQQRRDDDTIAAHKDANYHVQKNERHVLYAYAGMWIVAAGFVIFLWRRQQGLKSEIANLRRDLESAGGDKPAGGRS